MNITEVKEILRKSPVFHCLNDDELEDLCSFKLERTLKVGEVLLYQDDIPEYFYVVMSGRIKAFSNLPSGREVILTIMGPGDILGPLAVFVDKPTTTAIQAAENSVILAFEKKQFSEFLLNHPVLCLEMVRKFAALGRQLYHRLYDLIGVGVVQRVARILHILATKYGNEIYFSREEIAFMAGTSVETVIRIISQFKSAGIVDTKRYKISILNLGELKLLSDGKKTIAYYSSRATGLIDLDPAVERPPELVP